MSSDGALTMPSGLRHSSDDTPGIRRYKRGKGFSYRHDNGRSIFSSAENGRITKIAIPPAYRNVWICPSSQGHLQATGQDARGRKQYLYHPKWRATREETKFHRMIAFGSALPRIRTAVKRDLAHPLGAVINQVALVATLVRLLDTTFVRVGNEEYARVNKSFGLTTLRKRHAAICGYKLRLKFRGKSGVVQEVALKDKRVARVVRSCQALPGHELFKYQDESGELHSIGSAAINDYLGATGGGDFTAKDFRTWHGSAAALTLFLQMNEEEREAITPTVALGLIAEVARLLGNTMAVCRKSYIHPEVLALLFKTKSSVKVTKLVQLKPKAGLSISESVFLAFVCAIK